MLDMFPSDGSDPATNYRTVRKEIESFSTALTEKTELIAANKMDLATDDGAASAKLREELPGRRSSRYPAPASPDSSRCWSRRLGAHYVRTRQGRNSASERFSVPFSGSPAGAHVGMTRPRRATAKREMQACDRRNDRAKVRLLGNGAFGMALPASLRVALKEWAVVCQARFRPADHSPPKRRHPGSGGGLRTGTPPVSPLPDVPAPKRSDAQARRCSGSGPKLKSLRRSPFPSLARSRTSSVFIHEPRCRRSTQSTFGPTR